MAYLKVMHSITRKLFKYMVQDNPQGMFLLAYSKPVVFLIRFARYLNLTRERQR